MLVKFSIIKLREVSCVKCEAPFFQHLHNQARPFILIHRSFVMLYQFI